MPRIVYHPAPIRVPVPPHNICCKLSFLHDGRVKVLVKLETIRDSVFRNTANATSVLRSDFCQKIPLIKTA